MPFIMNEYWVSVEDLQPTHELNRLPLPPLTFPIVVGTTEKSVALEVDLAEWRSLNGCTKAEAEAETFGEFAEGPEVRREARRRRDQKERERREREATEGEPSSSKRRKTGDEESEGAGTADDGQGKSYLVVYVWFRLGDVRITVPDEHVRVFLVLPAGRGTIPVHDHLGSMVLGWRHRGGIVCGDLLDPFPRCDLTRRELQTANGVRHLHHALHHSRRYIRLRVEGRLEIPQPVLHDLASPQNYLLHPIASGYPTLPDDKPRRSPTLGQALFALVEKPESRETATFRIRCTDIHVEDGGREIEQYCEFYASRELFLTLETPEYFKVNNLFTVIGLMISRLSGSVYVSRLTPGAEGLLDSRALLHSDPGDGPLGLHRGASERAPGGASGGLRRRRDPVRAPGLPSSRSKDGHRAGSDAERSRNRQSADQSSPTLRCKSAVGLYRLTRYATSYCFDLAGGAEVCLL